MSRRQKYNKQKNKSFKQKIKDKLKFKSMPELYPIDDNVYIYSENTTNKLIIFVHGLNGDAISTWDNFLEFIADDEILSKYDSIFYSYKSLKYQALDHAVHFYDFLKTILDKNVVVNNPNEVFELNNIPIGKYKNILIVAHSLGAIVIREALLMANKDSAKWINKVKIALFAPAHNGAIIDKLIFETLNILSLTKLIPPLAKYKMPILNDLKEDSMIIKNIHKETHELLNVGKGDFTKSKLTIHASGDKVLTNLRFHEDASPKSFTGLTHKTVCKPHYLYKEPIQLIKEILK